eukprot:c52724_g1_i1 orf=49-198(-)
MHTVNLNGIWRAVHGLLDIALSTDSRDNLQDFATADCTLISPQLNLLLS